MNAYYYINLLIFYKFYKKGDTPNKVEVLTPAEFRYMYFYKLGICFNEEIF